MQLISITSPNSATDLDNNYCQDKLHLQCLSKVKVCKH